MGLTRDECVDATVLLAGKTLAYRQGMLGRGSEANALVIRKALQGEFLPVAQSPSLPVAISHLHTLLFDNLAGSCMVFLSLHESRCTIRFMRLPLCNGVGR